jgi:hypothetical protein
MVMRGLSEPNGSWKIILIENLAAADASRRLDQLQDRLYRDAFAAARFADDPHHLIRANLETHPIHGPDGTFVELKDDAEIAHGEQRLYLFLAR